MRFQLACACGAREFSILGFPAPSSGTSGQGVFHAPISLSCHSCGKTAHLFNPECDGYDGELDSSASVTASGEPSKFLCRKCGETHFLTAVSLEYAIEDEEMEDWEELAAKPQDFFTSFGLFGKCATCGHLASLGTWECA